MIKDGEYLSSPAQVIRALLAADGRGTMPGVREIDPSQRLLVDPPQIFTESVPNDVNHLIYVKNTAGMLFGHDQEIGYAQTHHGVSILVRHPDERGYTTAVGIFEFLSTLTYRSVTIGCWSYNIQSVYPTTANPIDLGEEEGKSRLRWAMDFRVAFQYPPRTAVEE